MQRISRQRGQAMTEYIIVVALVAIAAMTVFSNFGEVVRSQTTAMARELSGDSGSTKTADAQATGATSPKVKAFTDNTK